MTFPKPMVALLALIAGAFAGVRGFAAPLHQDSLVLDWVTLEIVPEKKRIASDALRASHAALVDATLTEPKSLEQLVQNGGNPSLTLNQQIMLGRAQGGTPRPNFRGNGKPWAMEPIWCSVANHDIFLLALIDMQTGQLLAAPHFSIERESWSKYISKPGLPTQLGERFKDLAKAAIQNANAQNSKDAMHVQFDLAKETTRSDQGSSLCLNLMLGGEMSQQYQVTMPAAAEMWAAVRRALAYPPTALRPTRRMILSWNLPGTDRPFPGEKSSIKGKPSALQLPLTFDLIAYGTESVLGQSLYRVSAPLAKGAQSPADQSINASSQPSHYQVTLASLDKASIQLQGVETIASDLSAEQKTLMLGDAPQISKVDRGWVYVDKGRAWGLHMDDRLVIGSGKDAIKGHVVGYFGPELKIKSPRGYLIQEGAIVFVRKGQKAAKPGMTFAFDSRTYPTPWPPKQETQMGH